MLVSSMKFMLTKKVEFFHNILRISGGFGFRALSEGEKTTQYANFTCFAAIMSCSACAWVHIENISNSVCSYVQGYYIHILMQACVVYFFNVFLCLCG